MNPRRRRIRRIARKRRALETMVRQIVRQAVRELRTDLCLEKAVQYATAEDVRRFLGRDAFEDPEILS